MEVCDFLKNFVALSDSNSKIIFNLFQIIFRWAVVSISLTYAVSRGLSIAATSHQFKPISLFSPHHQHYRFIIVQTHFSKPTNPSHCLLIIITGKHHPTAKEQTKEQTKPKQGGDELAASNPIINTPTRPDKTPPSQKLWIFKQFNFSGNKSSFERQQNAQNTEPWHLNKLRPKNSQLLSFSTQCALIKVLRGGPVNTPKTRV